MPLSGWMNADFTAYFIFVLAAAFAPSLGNVRLAAAAAKFGWRRVLPHAYGMTLGLMSLAGSFWFMLEAAYRQIPWLDSVMKWLSIAYLLWMAWGIAREKVSREVLEQMSPKTWHQAFRDVWTSPMSWTYVVALISAFMPQTESWWHVLAMLMAFPIAICPGRLTWLFFGATFQRFLRSAHNLRYFNIFLAALLIATLLPTLDN